MKKSFLFAVFCVFFSYSVAQAQYWSLSGGNTITGTQYLGSDASSDQPLRLRTGTSDAIVFQINGANEKMRLDASGNLGIGTASPTYLLHVNGGDINLADAADFYRIAGWEALFMDAPGNMMVGTRHPLSSLTSGINNVLVGQDCGKFLTTGNENTFFGTFAGKVSSTAENCTFVGHQAGTANTSGGLNTFLGNRAGVKNIEGHKNIFIGYRCGQNMTYGDDNVFAGSWSGSDLTDTTGNNQNVILGSQAGYNSPGSLTKASKVTLVGYNAEASDTLTNAGAIGANAYVEAKNALVLGSIAGVNGAGGAENTNVGIGTTTPDNRLEIVRGAQGNNVSGLRLWSLVGSTPDSPTGAVLTIDGNGDVILVSDTSGVSVIGNYCSEAQNPLTDSYEIPLGDYNYYFSGLEPLDTSLVSKSDVGIGMDCNSFLSGKLHVHQENISFPDQGSSGSAAGYFNNTATEAFRSYGIFSESVGSSHDLNFGGRFEAQNAEKENVGVEGVAVHPAANNPENYGGRFFADSATYNYGIWAEAPNVTDSWAAYIVGAGYLDDSSWSYASDKKLKKNISEIDNYLNLLQQLRPKKYEFRVDEFPQLNLPDGEKYGLIAQELEDVFPNLVCKTKSPAKLDKAGIETYPSIEFKSIKYTELIPILIGAIQEQQKIIEEKGIRIDNLEKEVKRLSALEDDMADINKRLAAIENKK